MTAPVYGLVLAGGFSRRMGRDKALLDYHGLPQALWTAQLLSAVCEKVFFSCRADQDLGQEGGFPRIHDAVEGKGPLVGMVTAAHQHPQAAWLVLACDLPRLTSATLEDLLRHRALDATAFRSPFDGLPDPLCALYEPAFVPVWEAALAADRRCPRKLLLENADRVSLLDPADPQSLDNANTPDELNAFRTSEAFTNAPSELRKSCHSTLSYERAKEQFFSGKPTILKSPGSPYPDRGGVYER